MISLRRSLLSLIALAGALVLTWRPEPAAAYVEAPHSLGQVVSLSTNILVLRVESVDRTNNAVVYRKVRDLKGAHKLDTVRHRIGKAGFHAREWQAVMNWAEVGKEAVFFYAGGAGECCIGMNWYQIYAAGGELWTMSHGEPFLLRSFAGQPAKLAAAVTDMLAGREVVVPCMVDGNKDDLHLARARIQRLRASLKLLTYDAKRDFVGWGGEDFRRLAGMAGFTHASAVARVDPDAQCVSAVDFNGDGKPDLCLVGAGRVALLQNAGESLSELGVPDVAGSRAAVWADYNGDGRPDLLLATPTGPRLLTNLGDRLRDDSHLLPREPAYNLTAAAWIDQDGDGRPDVLLGNGFYGLRLYRNQGKSDKVPPLVLGAWHYAGPFANGGKGFATDYGPEKEVDLKAKYKGKDGEEVVWRAGKFTDGAVNGLQLFKPAHNADATVYLYRQIECDADRELPVSLGSDDTLTVWLNGKKLVEQNVARACAPDQAKLTLKLQKGKNDLLLKVCQGGGDWAFYFNPVGEVPKEISWTFQDVSDAVGLGEDGVGGDSKGDTLTVCDVDGDGRTDFLYGAGKGVLARNTGKKFVAVKGSGVAYQTGKAGPVFADFDGDGRPDLFVPQPKGCKLFRNDGDGKFTDVTAKAGLGKLTARCAGAAWGDLDNDGHLDLVVGCLKAPNVFFRNNGDGTFTDAGAKLGLDKKVFNTQGVCLLDLNGDGALDVVFNNEGQDSCVLLGDPERAGKRTPVTLQVAPKTGAVGGRVRVLDKAGKLHGCHFVSGGDGRGGQAPAAARFALAPGTYKVELRLSSGEVRAQPLVVATTHVKGVLDDKTPKVD